MCLDPVTAAAAYGVSRLGRDKVSKTTTTNTGDTIQTWNTTNAASPTPVSETTEIVETLPESPKKTSDDSSLNIPKKKTTRTPNKQSLQTPKTINY